MSPGPDSPLTTFARSLAWRPDDLTACTRAEAIDAGRIGVEFASVPALAVATVTTANTLRQRHRKSEEENGTGAMLIIVGYSVYRHLGIEI